MRFGVFCHRGDETSLAIAQRLNQVEPGSCGVFDLAVAGQSVALHADRILWNTRDLGRLKTAWVSGLPYTDPVPPPAGVRTDWSLWNIDHLIAQQTCSALESVFLELERRGVQVVNPRQAALERFMVPHQLLRLGRAGCRVPDLLVSNDTRQVEEFCRAHAAVVWRPVTGSGAWQRFTDRQRLHLVAVDKPPVLLAEGAPSDLLRAWLFDATPLLCLRIEAAEQRAVTSLGAQEEFGDLARLETLETVVVADGDDLRAALEPVVAVVGWRWMQVTFAMKGGGALVYEVDPDPRFDWLPAPLRDWLVDACALRLLGLEPDAAFRPVVGTRLERPALFLRRMLQIQFEMEGSKYPDADS